LNNEFIDDEIELTYFDGFSFKMDTSKWTLVINESNKLLGQKDSINSVGQVDGSSYLLSNDTKTKICCDPYNPNLVDRFKNLESLIKSELMRDIYKRRLDIGQQADRDLKKEEKRTGAQQ
jgi:hypothetical protein